MCHARISVPSTSATGESLVVCKIWGDVKALRAADFNCSSMSCTCNCRCADDMDPQYLFNPPDLDVFRILS